TCDICDQFGRFSVFVTYMVLTLFFIPTFRWNRRYYVRTSCCNTIYELDPSIGRRIEAGEQLTIRDEDLTLVSRGRSMTSHKKCPVCGYETEEDFEYCPMCGRRF
ncbi:MAG: zinc ribbon domain-containing protein, partial [Erysipelotrichaceae bacterium]|nr:zinc ribbon domain-containing protein [Erysipelotrichaceae bacterium]